MPVLYAGQAAQAQSQTSSPYSMFGIGQPATALYGQTAGMGGVAYGMRGSTLLNNDNPASFTALDSCRLIAEIAAGLQIEYYRSGKQSNTAWQGNFVRFALGGRLMKRWYAGAGIAPYSSVGYYFNTYEPVEGTNGTYMNSRYEGSGGLSEAYWTNAFQLSRNWSVGVNLSYIFGNIYQTETQDEATAEQKMSASAFYADFGCQYTRRVNKETTFTVGLVYGYRQPLDFSNRVEITGSNISSAETRRTVRQYLPDTYGAGGSLHYKKMYYAFDYAFRHYSVLSAANGSRVKFRDAHEWKTGVSYVPDSYVSDAYVRRMEYKAGLSVSVPYMQIGGHDGRTVRASLGVAFPVSNGKVGVAAFYDHTRYGGNLLTGKTAGISVIYTLSEKFFRGRLE